MMQISYVVAYAIHTQKCKSFRHSRHSLSSVAAKAAALEVKESFLKQKPALRMATEELELRQQKTQKRLTRNSRRNKMLTE